MSGEGDRPPLINPFSSMAVATVASSGDGGADITVPTEPINRAIDQVRMYLRSSPAETRDQPDGNVIMVLGDYGTGKTHLARRLMEVAAEELPDSRQSLHIEATAENLLKTYRRFVDELTLDRVRARVNDYYADIVAKQLQEKTITSSVAQALRKGDQTPKEVVASLGLMESALLRELQRTLRAVTANDDFAKALALLPRSGFDKAVWSWLRGGQPAEVLIDRGITAGITAPADVFEAMGVLALLLGGARRRFLMVIDEFDRIFELARSADHSVAGAFQKMLEVFTKAGACLVLCGHPGFVNTLDSSARERITHTVEMTGLNTVQVIEFIELVLGRGTGEATLEPFSERTVSYLVTLTAGNARKVIRTCHQLFQMAWQEDVTAVTFDMVRTAVRDQLGSLGSKEVIARAAAVLDANGWPYRRDHFVGPDRRSRVEFWLPGDGRAGCAVLISDSLLTHEEFTSVTERVHAVHKAVGSVGVVLVVSGVLDPSIARILPPLLQGEPLVYVEHDFVRDFKALVSAVVGSPSGSSQDPQRGMGQLTRQQENLHKAVEQLVSHVEGSRQAIDRRLTLIQRSLAEARTEGSDDHPWLPPDVERQFVAAAGALDDITQFDAMFREALTEGDEEVRRTVQRRLLRQDFRPAAGVASLMSYAVRAFEEAIRAWYGTSSPGELSPADEEALDDICLSYDAVSEYLPLFLLDPLIQLTPWPVRGSDVTDLDISARRARVFELLETLSVRVRNAVLSSIPSVER